MLLPVGEDNRALFELACGFEGVMGSKCLNSLECYGSGGSDVEFLCAQTPGGQPTGALYRAGDVLLIPEKGVDEGEIAAYIRDRGVKEVDTSLALAQRLQGILGGRMESSYYMVYPSGPVPEDGAAELVPCRELDDVFQVLRQSHEYYRTHLEFAPWAKDITLRRDKGFLELYQLNLDGKPVGTGSIVSQDRECGVIAAVAVIPEYRGRGLGRTISTWLTNRVLELGKTPRLISGYDEVAALYRGIGYVETGRWGELYL